MVTAMELHLLGHGEQRERVGGRESRMERGKRALVLFPSPRGASVGEVVSMRGELASGVCMGGHAVLSFYVQSATASSLIQKSNTTPKIRLKHQSSSLYNS